MRIEDLHYPMPTAPVDEKNFDIDRWRRENPMDYLKALYLLLSSVNWVPDVRSCIVMDCVFQSIYQVTRQYTPDVLYKFCSLTNDEDLNEKKLLTLQNKSIFMSDIKAFNDPFDGKAYFYRPEELKEIEHLKPFDGKLIDDFTAFHKGTSLTENDTSCMPMWAHYSNNHQGYCVAYNMKDPDNIALSSCTFPIQYTEQRLDVTSFIKKYESMVSMEVDKQTAQGKKQILINDLSIIYMAQFLCNIKQSTWQYEREFRCTMAANAKGMPYIEASPQAIYIGMNCCERNRTKLIKIAQQLSIPVYQMKLDEFSENYALEATLLNI